MLPGGPPSPWMTLYILHGFSKGLEFGVDAPKDVVVRAWSYMHRHYIDVMVDWMMADDCCWETITFLNYVNPMVMNCWAIDRGSTIKTVGLCHSVQGTAGQLARDIGVPLEEINYICAGINHMAFYLNFERKTADGVEDLTP